jgi:hypothetical protein
LTAGISVSSLSSDSRMRIGIKGREYRGGLRDPFPTTFREVSGRKTTINNKHNAPDMLKNQNIQCQFPTYTKKPPNIGPRDGATVPLF